MQFQAIIYTLLARAFFKQFLASSLVASAEGKVGGRCRENEKHIEGGVALCCIEGSSMPCLLCKTHQKEGGINKSILFSACAGTQHCK